jgi:hypothetical protein
VYQKLLKWCHDSEVILASRLQVLGGVLLVVINAFLPFVTQENLQLFIGSPKTIAVVLVVSGVVMEVLRHHRATDLEP